MNFLDYISNDFRAIALSNTVKEVKEYFNILPFSHFVVFDNDLFKGIIDKNDLSNYPDQEIITNLIHLLKLYSLTSHDNLIEALSFFAQNDTDIIPVFSENQTYLGYIVINDIIKELCKTPFLKTNGTTLIIERDNGHFSFSEISQIIESNDIKVLGLFISNIKQYKTEITLKLQTENVNDVIQTLRRYEYDVINQNEQDLFIDQLKKRSDYLQRFFDI